MAALQDIYIPQEYMNDEFVTVLKLFYQTGDVISSGETILEFEASKANVSVSAEAEGYIEFFCKEGDVLKIGQLAARIHTEKMVKIENPGSKLEIREMDQAGTRYSIQAMELINSLGIDKSLFGGKDLVSKDDVKKVIPVNVGGKKENEESVICESDAFDYKQHTPAKNAEINQLLKAGSVTSTVYMHVNFNDLLPQKNNNNYLLSIIVKEVFDLLKEYKEMNAFYLNGGMAWYNYVAIGLAIDIDKGLKVIKLPDVDAMSLKEIQSTIINVMKKYIKNTLRPADIQGCTFTISDLSNEQVAFFTPLISEKQAAVLGVSSLDDKLNRVTLALTFDHRVTEGRRASMFLMDLKKRIEQQFTSWGLE